MREAHDFEAELDMLGSVSQYKWDIYTGKDPYTGGPLVRYPPRVFGISSGAVPPNVNELLPYKDLE